MSIAGTPVWVRVALDVPLAGPFDYRANEPVEVGLRVIVPFGRRHLIGVVTELPDAPAVAPEQVRDVEQVLRDVPPLPADWLRLAAFAADYYQRPLGEVMMPALPGPLRKPSSYQSARAGAGPVARLDARQARQRKASTGKAGAKKKGAAQAAADVAASVSLASLPAPAGDDAAAMSVPAEPVSGASGPAEAGPGTPTPGLAQPELNAHQQAAVDAIAASRGFSPVLLHGVTGSGKTEVYLRAVQAVLARGKQALLLVPEINLTPQLQQVLVTRLQAMAGVHGVAVLHSGLAEGERLAAWMQAVRGEARVVLGTRLSLLTPLPQLGLIVVDEEHDPSYKQQEGLRYSARDLAIWRARDLGITVLLGSATPSLESWHHARSKRYLLLSLPDRAVTSTPPTMRLIDTRRLTLKEGMSEELTDAIGKRLEQGQQALVFLNRRGYAPVLTCAACSWVSGCAHCSAHMVLHRGQGGSLLRCHHCGGRERIPRACPDCGNQDLEPMGRGTQRVEEHLAQLFPEARIVRIDADSTRLKGSAERLFGQVHAGEVDILVGTQMVAKGHDFRNLGLVGVLNADSMLFSHDFRAPERLFAQLMQVAGRAGRHTGGSEVMIQTGYPEQPVYQSLLRHDYVGFATHGLEERESAGLPPFAHQALLTAEAGTLPETLTFLGHAREVAEEGGNPHYVGDNEDLPCFPPPGMVTVYDPVPLRVVRVKNVERAQLLVESASRPALQAFLRAWLARLPGLPAARRVRWQLEVDPLEI